MAMLLRVCPEPPTLVLIVRGEPFGFLAGDGKDNEGVVEVGVENDCLLGSTRLCNSESVRNGVRLALVIGDADGGVKVRDEWLDCGTKVCAIGFKFEGVRVGGKDDDVGIGCLGANGGGGAVSIFSEGGSFSSSPSELRGGASPSDLDVNAPFGRLKGAGEV